MFKHKKTTNFEKVINKENKVKNIRLNNIIFPIWLIWLFPQLLIFVLPGNFIIDSLVLLITMYIMKIEYKKGIYKKTILKIWGFGFLSDIIGAVFLLIPIIIDGFLDFNSSFGNWWYHYLVTPISFNPFDSIFGFIWVAIGVFIAGLFIYFFNYKFTFKEINIKDNEKKKLALSLAIFTAPYLFFLPTQLFYY